MMTSDTIARLRSGELDLTEYLSSLCDRIDSGNPKIYALLPDLFDRQSILREASKLLAQYPDPISRPPLFGTPVGVKDIFRVDGFPTRCGSMLPPRLFEGPEAISVSRLKEAGAVVMGKTVTTEFAWFEPGPTRNPHHLEHTPGGSSSGSAAAVAMGFFPFALGTQTAGSITRPAAFCGIVGFKPSFGRIPTAGLIPTSPSADHVGILCHDPSGLGTLLSILMEDWKPGKDLSRSKKVTLALPEGPYLEQATENGREFFERSLTRLAHAGYEIVGVNPFTDIRQINEDHLSMAAGEMARVHRSWFKEHRHLYRPKTVETIEKGLKASDEELERLCAGRLRLREDLEQQMESKAIDLWICPSTPDHAPRGLESTGSPIMNLPWTYAGLPTISLPAGMDGDGLPQGIQIVGRYGQDEKLIAAAKGLFDALGGIDNFGRARPLSPAGPAGS